MADLDDRGVKRPHPTACAPFVTQAKADSEQVQAMLESSTNQAITPQMVERFAATARKRMRLDGGGYRRDHLRAFAQREVFIKGSKDELLRTLAGIGGGKSACPVLY
jgi:site-specific DNA recombinase